MQQLFLLNPEIRKCSEIILLFTSSKVVTAEVVKLAQYDLKIACIANLEKRRNTDFNIPYATLESLNPEKENIAVIVAGYKCVELAEELKKRGFKNIFIDYLSELGSLRIFGGNNSGQLLVALEGEE